MYCPGYDAVMRKDPADRQGGKTTITYRLHYISKDQKCWGAWHITIGHTAKDIIPKKEEVIDAF